MELKVEIFKIQEIIPHDNADNLEIVHFYDYPCVVKKGDFKPGDLAAYIPVGALVPFKPEFFFLHQGNEGKITRRVIRAMKLRGVYSEGLVWPVHSTSGDTTCLPDVKEGDDVAELLGITKYVQRRQMPSTPGQPNSTKKARPKYAEIPEYTDLSDIRGHKYALKDEDNVVIMEKIHGTNSRYGYVKVFRSGVLGLFDKVRDFFGCPYREFIVASRTVIKHSPEGKTYDWHYNGGCLWHRCKEKYKLEQRYKQFPDYVFFGEIYGDGVQDLKYGLKDDFEYVLFDIYDNKRGAYLDYDEFCWVLHELNSTTAPSIKKAPVLTIGTWGNLKDRLPYFRDGKSILAPAQIREGCVIKTYHERKEHNLPGNRMILKCVSPDYKLRNNPTEYTE